MISEVAAWMRGEVIERTPVGASYLVSVRAQESYQGGAEAPLVYHDRSYHRVDDQSAL